MHGGGRIEAGQGRIAQSAVLERHCVDPDIARACGGDRARHGAGRLLPVAEDDHASTAAGGCDGRLDAGLEIGRSARARLHVSGGQRLGTGGEPDDAAGNHAPAGLRPADPACLDVAHRGVDARGAVDREHRARGARAGVRIGQRGHGGERAEHGSHAREADPAPGLARVHARHRSQRQ